MTRGQSLVGNTGAAQTDIHCLFAQRPVSGITHGDPGAISRQRVDLRFEFDRRSQNVPCIIEISP